MLTLVESKDAVPLLDIYTADPKKRGKQQSVRKKRIGTVFFTHDLDPDKQNVSDASGVLHLHKTALKKENHVNDCEFEEIAGRGAGARSEFGSTSTVFIGDDPSTQFELNLSSRSGRR